MTTQPSIPTRSASELGQRAEQYRRLILSAPYEICIERARYVTESFQRTEGQHPSLRAARAFAHCAQHVSVRIGSYEGIAGNQTSKVVGTAIPIERGEINVLLALELDSLLARPKQPYHIEPADRRELEQHILPYWRGRTVRDYRKRRWRDSGRHIEPSLSPRNMWRRFRSLNMRALSQMAKPAAFKPLAALREMKEISYDTPGLVMNSFDVQGHLILGNKNVLPGGFAALKSKAQERLDRCERQSDADGVAFCQAAIICCDAIALLASRYAVQARRDAAGTTDEQRRVELLAMADRCDRVPFHPPRDFLEAIQALWLTQVGAIVAYGMTGIFAVGRPDQYLWPYYEQDLKRQAIDAAQALPYLQELLVKLSSNLLMLPTVGKSTGSELGADSQAVTVGGVDAEGNDATNELSYLFLDAVAGVKGLGNTFSIRVSEKSPSPWLARAAQVLRHTSGPALFNDEKVIQALEHCGYPLADARQYAVIGCVEPTSEGNTFGCTSGNDISMAGALEMTLLAGTLRMVGRRVGPNTGDPRRFDSFAQLWHAFQQQVRFMIDTIARAVDIKDEVYAEHFHNPYVSLTLDGCLDSARDMTCGGAQYNFSSISARGVATAVDSLAALRTAVYDRKKFTMSELLDALEHNFRGREVMRQYLLHRCPKFGSDDPEVNALAHDLVSFFCDEVSRRRGYRGGPFRPGFFSYGMHVLEGALLGATPDGRLAGQPISNSLSPTNGSERAGPTGVLNSLTALDHTKISNGSALNMRLLPSLLDTEERRQKFCALMRGYFQRGGMEVQFNVVDDATLRRAQQHPEQYRDLVVRVSGYAAFFTDLGPAIQNEIISRTAFGRY